MYRLSYFMVYLQVYIPVDDLVSELQCLLGIQVIYIYIYIWKSHNTDTYRIQLWENKTLEVTSMVINNFDCKEFLWPFEGCLSN